MNHHLRFCIIPEEFYIDTFKNSFNNAKYIAELKGIKDGQTLFVSP